MKGDTSMKGKKMTAKKAAKKTTEKKPMKAKKAAKKY